MSTREVVFVDAVRTAFGRMGGSLKDLYATRMAGIAIDGLLDKTNVHEKAHVDSVFLGSATHCSVALNPARHAVLSTKLPQSTSASYVEMQCGSAIDAINHAAWKILAGQADIVIAGGMESYSQMPFKFPSSTPPHRLMPPMPITQKMSPLEEECIGMGLTAENLAEMYDIPRAAADEFAYASQVRAKEAMDAGFFDEEIIPVKFEATRKTPAWQFDRDEHPRPQSTLEGMAKLPSVFKKDGTVTAGNASGQNDGAAFVLMMDREKALALGYTPMARWLSGADVGCDPKIMGIGPALAIPVAAKRAGLSVSDIDVFECNEAFAVQNLAVIKEIETASGQSVDMDKWNPYGGAIAFGHPNGASGARICMFAMRHMIRNAGRYGVFSSCCGGGLGVATVIENLQR